MSRAFLGIFTVICACVAVWAAVDLAWQLIHLGDEAFFLTVGTGGTVLGGRAAIKAGERV